MNANLSKDKLYCFLIQLKQYFSLEKNCSLFQMQVQIRRLAKIHPMWDVVWKIYQRNIYISFIYSIFFTVLLLKTKYVYLNLLLFHVHNWPLCQKYNLAMWFSVKLLSGLSLLPYLIYSNNIKMWPTIFTTFSKDLNND